MAASLRQCLEAALPAGDEIERNRLLSAIRLCLGEPAFAAQWAAGQAMALEQAVAFEEPVRDEQAH